MTPEERVVHFLQIALVEVEEAGVRYFGIADLEQSPENAVFVVLGWREALLQYVRAATDTLEQAVKVIEGTMKPPTELPPDAKNILGRIREATVLHHLGEKP